MVRSQEQKHLLGIRGVWFDAVGTLLFPNPPAPVVYESVGRRLGSRLTREEITARFREAFHAEEARDRDAAFRTSEEREQTRWRRIVAHSLPDVADGEAFFQELFGHFARPEAWVVAAGAQTVLEHLGSGGVRLGLASNYDHRLRTVVAGHAELRALGRLAISAEIGWRKPAPEFFDRLATDFSLPREQMLFVGDDPTNDWQGARDAGFRAVLVHPHGHGPAGAVVIAKLTELLARG